jgi:multiple sugar transport system ATP-binding protein
MRDGKVQQVDAPKRLYENPTNLFVAAFIGSPAMNLAKARIEEDAVALGHLRIPLTDDNRPPVAPGETLIVGIRPEAFEDVAFAEPDLPQFDVTVRVLEELGADSQVFFEVDTEPVVVEEALSDEGDETGLLAEERGRALFAARVDPRTSARVGGTIRLAVDPSRLYFFSPETGESLVTHGAVATA